MEIKGQTPLYRYERKFYLSLGAARVLQGRAAALMQPDAHTDGEYRVQSLYFDDRYATAVHQKVNGVLRRAKWRVRWYNGDTGFLRLECKHKNDIMIHKESATLTPQQFERMQGGDYAFMLEAADPLFQRFYADSTLKGLRPAVLVDYRRRAFVYGPGNVRLTFDTQLAASRRLDGGRLVPLDQEVILELKYDRLLPSVVAQLLSGVPVSHTAISKFVLAQSLLA